MLKPPFQLVVHVTSLFVQLSQVTEVVVIQEADIQEEVVVMHQLHKATVLQSLKLHIPQDQLHKLLTPQDQSRKLHIVLRKLLQLFKLLTPPRKLLPSSKPHTVLHKLLPLPLHMPGKACKCYFK